MRLRTGLPRLARVQGVQSLGWPPGCCNGRVVMRSSKPFCKLARGQAVYGVAGVALACKGRSLLHMASGAMSKDAVPPGPCCSSGGCVSYPGYLG